MNPGPKNSKNTAVTFARKKYRNKRTTLQGQKKNTRLHWPAPRQTKMPPQRCWTTKATENPEQNQESGGEREKKKKAKENATKNHQRDKTQSESKARGLSATCSQTYVRRAPLGFTQKSTHAAPRNKGPESSKTRHRGRRKKNAHRKHTWKSQTNNSNPTWGIETTKSTPTRRIGTNPPRRQDFTTMQYAMF